MEGERWDIEAEREGKINWKIWKGNGKEEGIVRWRLGEREREKEMVAGISDASKEEDGRIGIGGMYWEEKRKKKKWSKSLGWGWTVTEGEAWGVGEVLEKVRNGYGGKRRKLIVGTDSKGVLEWLGKGRGMCGGGREEGEKIGKGVGRERVGFVYGMGTGACRD